MKTNNKQSFSLFLSKKEELINYPWSSYAEYIGDIESGMINKFEVIRFLKKNTDYEKFVLDQADYVLKSEIIDNLKID